MPLHRMVIVGVGAGRVRGLGLEVRGAVAVTMR